jgi:anti-anti-sigma factor
MTIEALPRELVGTPPLIEVLVEDDLDIALLPRLRDQLDEALALHPDLLRLDLELCPLVDAPALAVLVSTARRARRQQTRMVLRGCNDATARLLRVTGTHGLFTVEPAGKTRRSLTQPHLA